MQRASAIRQSWLGSVIMALLLSFLAAAPASADAGFQRWIADFESIARFADALEISNTVQVDQRPGPLGPVLEPVEAVLAAGNRQVYVATDPAIYQSGDNGATVSVLSTID